MKTKSLYRDCIAEYANPIIIEPKQKASLDEAVLVFDEIRNALTCFRYSFDLDMSFLKLKWNNYLHSFMNIAEPRQDLMRRIINIEKEEK